MAITRSLLVKNDGADVTSVAGAASQTVTFDDRSDRNLVLRFENTDVTNPCRIKFAAGDGMSAGQGDLDVDIAVSSVVAVGHLESARFIDASGEVTFEILDQDNTAFTGAVTDVLVEVLELPKALTD